MTQPVIRHAESSDYKNIIRVVNEWWGGRDMAPMLPRLFLVHFRNTSFVAEHQGEIVGFVIGFVSQTFPAEAYIHFTGVHPAFRKTGLGRRLYERFFSAAESLGCSKVRCVTSPVNKLSIAFHLGMGFTMEDTGTFIDGIPLAKGYDGEGEDRVLFSRCFSRSEFEPIP